MMRSHDPLPPDLQVRANIARLDGGRNGKPNHETTPTTPSTPIFGELPTAPPSRSMRSLSRPGDSSGRLRQR